MNVRASDTKGVLGLQARDSGTPRSSGHSLHVIGGRAEGLQIRAKGSAQTDGRQPELLEEAVVGSGFNGAVGGPAVFIERRRKLRVESVEKVQQAANALWLKLPLSVLLIFVAIIVWWPYFGKFEGSLFPVTSTLEFEEQRQLDDGTWQITASFIKHRPCEFKALAFYWIDSDGAQTRIPWENAERTTDAPAVDLSRPAGLNRVTLNMLARVKPDRYKAHTLHSCHPFYTTLTVIYP